MWASNDNELIWELQNEQVISPKSEIYQKLPFDLMAWADKYKILYKDWLDNDNHAVYDIYQPENWEVITALMQCKSENYRIFYWFDVDRNRFPDFEWKHCPVCGDSLVDLGKDYPSFNRLISPKYPIVFPL